MPSLRPGNRVVVETRTATFTYRIDIDPADLVVADDDMWVVSRLPRNPTGGLEPAQRAGQRLITLTTCSELFHTNDRMVAFGHLLSTRLR
jgi:sortase A